MHSPEIIHRKMCVIGCVTILFIWLEIKSRAIRGEEDTSFVACVAISCLAEQVGHRTKSIHSWFGLSGLCNGWGPDTPRTIFISVQNSAPRQDKHLVRWTLCCNCPPFSQALCWQGEKQTFRQGYKMALLKVPEGWSNTNFTESHLNVSETQAFKAF